jgi:hypothetical protein
LKNGEEAEMALCHIESHLCASCGRSMEQVCEVWTIGDKEYCRRCLDADRFKEASRKSSRAYIAVAFIIALLTLAFAVTPKARAQDIRHEPNGAFGCEANPPSKRSQGRVM